MSSLISIGNCAHNVVRLGSKKLGQMPISQNTVKLGEMPSSPNIVKLGEMPSSINTLSNADRKEM
jgi:hypothetical protein